MKEIKTQNMNQLSGLEKPIVTPVTARGRRTKQRLLKAAETVFGKHGYENASISEITRLAKVGQGTFYLYFPDKKSIFTELVQNLSHLLRQTIAKTLQEFSNLSRMEVERLGLQSFFAFVKEHKNLYRIVRQAEFVDETLFRSYYQKMAQGYTAGLAQAMDQNEIQKIDPETLAYCLMGIGDFLGMRWVLWEDGNLPPHVFDSMLAFIRNGMASQAPTKKTPEQKAKPKEKYHES